MAFLWALKLYDQYHYWRYSWRSRSLVRYYLDNGNIGDAAHGIVRRYAYGMPEKQIAEEMGVTRERARQIVAKFVRMKGIKGPR